jgi:hypothetical protein
MYKNSALLSIGAALVFSLFFFGVGHAFQIDRNQDARVLMAGEMNGAASLSAKQVSNTPTPCAGRTAATCRTQSQPGSGAMATDGSRYTNHVSNTPNPCGGRTAATCRTQSQPGSAAMATDGSRYISESLLVSLPAAGVIVGAGLIALFGLGTKKLRQHHEYHA